MAFPAAAQLFNIAALKPPETVFDNSLKPWQFTTPVPAIAYDNGGSAVGYNSLSQNGGCTANGSSYRADYIVGNFKPSTLSPPNPAIPYQICTVVGDWYQYTISSSGAGPFNLTLYTANPNGGANWAVSIDGTQVATVVAQGNGSDFNTVLPATSGQFGLAPGNHFLRLTALSGDPVGGLPGDFVQWQGGLAGQTVPAPAVAAGFTTNVLKADFTVPGNFWSNTANYITNCGAAASVPNQPSTWHFTYSIWQSGGIMSCSDAFVGTDPLGGQVLNLRVTASQYNGDANLHANNGAVFIFPASSGGSTSWLPSELYTRIILREDASSYQSGVGIFDWWATTTTYPSSLGWIDVDQAEVSASGNNSFCRVQPAPGPGFYGQLQGVAPGGGLLFSPVECDNSVDVTQFHTLEGLTTSNENSAFQFCIWYDGAFAGCTALSPSASAGAMAARDRRIVISNETNGASSITNDLLLHVKSIEVWACSNVASNSCPGTIVSNWCGDSTTGHAC